MKKLRQFIHFDFEGFSEGKTYVVTGISPWNDFETKEHLGTKVEVVIAQDKTPYVLKEGENVSNLYEKLVFKVAKDGVALTPGTPVVPVGVVAKVWGDYSNKLAVECKDVKPVPRQG